MPEKRAHVYVSGRVQGVFFRSYTKQMADREGLTGWVRNLPDGRVEAVFEGDAASVDRAVDWCRNEGSPMGHVDRAEVSEERPTGEFREFSVRY
jgi:acylphosphatase